MSHEMAKIFEAFDRGKLTRRQLMLALGVGAGIAALPRRATLLGQGQCGGARAGTPDCDTTPAKLPFESTGWKTVRLNHVAIQVADYAKEAAYYAALMNWTVRSDDGKQAVLDIGDWGGAIIRGGYEAPPPPPAPARPPTAPATTPPDAAGGGQRAGGGGRGGPRAPRLAQVESFSWGITPWDTKKVEAELKKRGIQATPLEDKNLPGFRFKDPGGWTCDITDGRVNPRAKTPNGKLSVPAPFESTDWKTVWLDHISFEVPNYKESVAFYQALLGWSPTKDEGSQNFTDAGDVGGLIIRRGASGAAGGRRGADSSTVNPQIVLPPPPPRPAGIGHIAFGIQPWDPDKVKDALDKRGLNARVDTGGKGDIHGASYQSYHTTTPNGFDLQISFVTIANRHAGIG
jgi:catechol 2,3-dioxygenase-like lactoylglutathione lyase family enzyme